MARIPFLQIEQMSPAQREIHDAVVSGPRGNMVGPLRAAIHSPQLATRWSKLGEYLRYDTVLEPRLSELAILVTGRRWSSQVEWWIHASAAENAGLSVSAIESIQYGLSPMFDARDEAEIYEFARHLQLQGDVPVPLYEAVKARHGIVGVVELVALIGYYTMVSMTLNAHEIPLPDGIEKPLSEIGLASLAPAKNSTGNDWSWHAPALEENKD